MIRNLKSYLRENPLTKKLYFQLALQKNTFKNRKKRRSIHKNGIQLMKTINEQFNKMGICYFFDFGTLLGIIRDNRLLKHDLDMDVGVLCEEGIHNKVRKNLLAVGFKLVYEYMIEKCVVEESYVCFDVKIDINYYFNSGTKSICYLFYRAPDKEYDDSMLDVVELTCDRIDVTQEVEFNGIFVRIPENPEHLLEQRYGANWRIPDKNWVYWKGPSAKPFEKQGIRIVHLKI